MALSIPPFPGQDFPMILFKQLAERDHEGPTLVIGMRHSLRVPYPLYGITLDELMAYNQKGFQCHRLAASHVNRSDVMTLYGPVLRLAWLTLDLRQHDLQGARLPHSPLKAIF